MKYVALLRGINVGGKSKVEMIKLKSTFESVGCKKVSTYINSGNVIFSDERPTNQLVPIIKKGIENDFGLNVRIVLRDHVTIHKLCKTIPIDWTNDTKQRTDVLFLWDEINKPEILKSIKFNPDIENMMFIDGAVVWNIGRENVMRGGGVKLIKTDLYKHMTIRNINTVRKLDELMRDE
ncbi:MAG: DUF1697 domain-containing protein [Candidatus Saccharibacteria bacterium]|nr:DUF1697 domain-containing protein [Candidatus Saccharibacteria bacterium]